MKLKEMNGVRVVINNEDELTEYLTICSEGGWVTASERDPLHHIAYFIQKIPTTLGAVNGFGFACLGFSKAEITLAEFKKEQGIMKYKEGDVLIDKYNNEVKILGICGLVYFRSEHGNPTKCSGSGFTEEELKGYTLKTDPPKLTTLSMEDVAKLAGVDVSSLRIEKGG